MKSSVFCSAAALWLATASSILAAAPPNDNRSDAIAISTGQALSGTTVEATPEDGDPAVNHYHTVWYQWTAGASGYFTARIHYPPAAVNWSEAIVRILHREVNGSLTEVARSAFGHQEGTEQHSEARFFAEPGGSYFLFVSSTNGAATSFSLTLSILSGRPAQDDFAQAGALPVTGGSVPMNGATHQPGEPLAGRENPGPWQGSVWMDWTAPQAGWYLARIESPSGEAAVDVWRGASLAALASAVTGVSGGGRGAGIPPGQGITFFVTSGETIHVRLLSDSDALVKVSILRALPGDHFADPLNAGTATSFEHRQPTADLTMESGETEGITGSLWVRWQAPDDAVYRAEVIAVRPGYISGLDPRLLIGQGETLTTLTDVAPVPLGIVSQPVFFRAVAGKEYRFQAGITPFSGLFRNDGPREAVGPVVARPGSLIFDLGNWPSEFTFRLQKVGQPPPNDAFASAGEIGAGTTVSVTGSNVAATRESDEALSPYQSGDSVWNRWTAPVAGGRWEALLESPALLKMELFRGETLASLNLIAGLSPYEDGAGGQIPLQLRWTAVPGERYHFRMRGAGYGSQGAYTLRMRQMNPPPNMTAETAVAVPAALPASASGSTVDAGGDSIQAGYGAQSSVWWKWTAAASGWLRLSGTGGTFSVQENSQFTGNSSYGGAPIRFFAEAGHTYHIRMGTPAHSEGVVSWTLEPEQGLDHTLPGLAIDLGNKMKASSSPYVLTPGYVFSAPSAGQSQAFPPNYPAVWYRWTAPASGWFSFDTEGSATLLNLRVYSGADRMVLGENGGWPEFPQFFPWGATTSKVSRSLVQINAGGTYLVQVTPVGNAETFPPAAVTVNIGPAAPPPEITAFQTRELGPANPDRQRFLEFTVSLVTPNGFAAGGIKVYWPEATGIGFSQPSVVKFDEHDRLSGDAFAGVYRAVIELSSKVEFSGDTPELYVADSRGGSVLTGPLRPGVQPDSIPPLPAWSTDAVPPVLESVSGLPPEIALNDADTVITLRLSIADFDGSGFTEGALFLQNYPEGIFSTGDPVRQWPAVTFGAAQRVKGEALDGIYEVSLTIPGHLPVPLTGLSCRLRDAAGNRSYSVWNLHGDVYMPEYRIPLSVAFTQTAAVDTIPPQSSEMTAVWESASLPQAPYGVVRVTGRLTDDLSGIAGGEVALLDANGLAESTKVLTAAHRLTGDAMDGVYQIVLPVPSWGFSGRHTVRWTVRDKSGLIATAETDSFSLPDRTTADQRRPRLTYFNVSPSGVDLTAGPADITVALGASDDRPGLTGVLRIFDSRGLPLAETPLLCSGNVLNCMLPLTLPGRAITGRSTEAAITLELRDAAGRTEFYGLAGSPSWPELESARLSLAPSPTPALQRWAADFPGYSLPANFLTDTDGDGDSDLVEFALGLDPAVRTRNDLPPPAGALFIRPTPYYLNLPDDPHSARSPTLSAADGFVSSFGDFSSAYSFVPAAGFVKASTDAYTSGDVKLTVETSADLIHWQRHSLPDRDSGGRVNVYESGTSGPRWFRLKVDRQP